MDKIDCIEDYFAGTRAYYLFQIGIFENRPEYLDFILDKKYMTGAKVSFASNIMLGIKEDLVDTKGAMDYQSKVFWDSLERSVNLIATKVPNGYKLSNYIFPDAATLVAIVRNKLAHGKYKIDFEHNRVILEHKGVSIVINIDKLVCFIMGSFGNKIRDVRVEKYERNLAYLQQKTEKLANGKIKDESDIKRIIKSFNCAKFKVESLNGLPVFPEYIKYFEIFLEQFNNNPYPAMKSDYYKQMVSSFKKNNYKISMEYFKLKDDEQIDKIVKFISGEILENNNLNYEQKLKFIGTEVQRSLDSGINSFNSLAANTHNLMLLDAISKTKSVDKNVLSLYIENKLNTEIRFSYDEYGMVLISMFNSLFMYPFDDVFETSGEYKVNRNSSFDFSNLDLSMIKPTICNIDESPIKNALDRCNALMKRQSEVSQKLVVQQNNLVKVKGNSIAEGKINANISDLNNSLTLLMTEYIKADSEYNMIKNDYAVNRLHFENRAIIEGIRNAIAHGNYEFNINGDFFDTEILLNDIYEGENTFSVKISFREFEEMIDKNYDIVLNYIRNKNNGMGRKKI